MVGGTWERSGQMEKGEADCAFAHGLLHKSIEDPKSMAL